MSIQTTTGLWSVYADSCILLHAAGGGWHLYGCKLVWGRRLRGNFQNVSLLALDSQTHQKGCRITSGIQLGKAVNNQTGGSTCTITHEHTGTLGQQQQQLIAWGFRLIYPCRTLHSPRQAALLERLINSPFHNQDIKRYWACEKGRHLPTQVQELDGRALQDRSQMNANEDICEKMKPLQRHLPLCSGMPQTSSPSV